MVREEEQEHAVEPPNVAEVAGESEVVPLIGEEKEEGW